MQFRLTKPKAYPAQIEQAVELEEKAKERLAEKLASQDRSDTDGFLSQHASGLMAFRDNLNAEILRNGGYWWFYVLVDRNGDIIADKIHKDNYSTRRYWQLWSGPAKKYDRFFIPFGAKSRVQHQLGMQQVQYWSPAKAVIGNNIVVPEKLEGAELNEFVKQIRRYKNA